MKPLFKLTCFVTLLVGLLGIQVFASVAVYYSFNSTNAIADIGTNISVFSYQNSGGFATNFSAGTTLNVQSNSSGGLFPAGVSISQDHWVGNTNFFQFTLNAATLQDIVVSYAWQRSSMGPTNAIFQYSLAGGGGSFVDFVTNAVPTDFTSAGGVVTQDLSTVSALDGDSNIAFRIVGINVGGTAGTLRLDNFTINAIPEPSTEVLVGLGLAVLVALCARRR